MHKKKFQLKSIKFTPGNAWNKIIQRLSLKFKFIMHYVWKKLRHGVFFWYNS